MNKPIFIDENHCTFYRECLARTRDDSYHRALFYLLALTPETRAHAEDLFSFSEDVIRPTGLRGGWQASGTMKICRLAFNLWNGKTETKDRAAYTPYDLFACGYAPYFVEAIKLRYPEYFREAERTKTERTGYAR